MEKIYKACDENQELKENYFLKINKNVLKKDLKEINAIEKLFQYFISEQVDVENGKSAKLLYEELGWNQNVSYDVINSFWITFSYNNFALFLFALMPLLPAFFAVQYRADRFLWPSAKQWYL